MEAILTRSHDQRTVEEVITPGELAVWCPLVHVGQVLLHRLIRNEGNVLEAKGLEDVSLEVVVQRETGDSFDENSCPVNPNL